MAKDSAVIELGRSFHQEGTVHLKKSVKVILCLFGMNNKVTFTYRTQVSGHISHHTIRQKKTWLLHSYYNKTMVNFRKGSSVYVSGLQTTKCTLLVY